MKHTMKHLSKPLATALAAALQFAATAAVPLVWDVVPTRATPAKFDRYHGETLDLKATFRGFGTLPFVPGADVRLYYQTNGMGAAWWNAPASVSSNVVTGTFSPNLDPGADSVTVFFGAPSNAYASAIIKLRPSPGFSPAAMPAPGIAGVVSLENYYTKDEVESKIAELAPTPGNYETVSNKAMNAVQPDALSGKRDYSDLSVNTNAWLLILPEGGMEWMEWNAVAYGGCWATLLFRQFLRWEADQWVFVDYTIQSSEQVAAPADATTLSFTLDWHGHPMTYRLHRGTRLALAEEVPGDYESVSNRAMQISMPDDDEHPPYIFDPYFHGTAQYAENAGGLFINQSPWALTVNDERWGMRYGYSAMGYEYRPFAYLSEVESVSNTANAAAFDASSALRIVMGERVWFAVANHMRTAEGVIPSLQLWEVRDSVTNRVYDSREEITNTVKALTRELHTELTNRIHDVEKTIPSKAWGNYQSDGTDNPEPGKVAIVNQPTVILTGGGTFNKYVEIGDSSIWVLTSSGPVSFGGGGTNGNYFAVLDDEGNAHFKVSKTDSFDVGAIFTDNPRTSGDALLLYVCSTNRQGEAYIGPPTLSACTNLQEAVWHDEADGEIDALGTSVAWARNDAIHAWVGTVTQDRWATAMYFRAKMKQEGGTAIINTAPVRFDGGVQFGNGTYRLVPYTTGGKTYLTVEGLQ